MQATTFLLGNYVVTLIVTEVGSSELNEKFFFFFLIANLVFADAIFIEDVVTDSFSESPDLSNCCRKSSKAQQHFRHV